MTDKDWKRWEREVAKDFGGSRGSRPGEYCDVHDIPDFAIECKLMAKPSLRGDHIAQARRNAAAVGKRWLIAIRIRRLHKKLIVMDYDDFLEMRNELRRLSKND